MNAPLTAVLLAVSAGARQGSDSPFEFRPAIADPGRDEGRLLHNHDSIELVAIRSRTSAEAFRSWDDCGLPLKSKFRNAPMPPGDAGRKVREFLFKWPERLPLLVKAPPGAEVVQIVQDRQAALVAVAFPLTAKVTSLEFGSPECRRNFGVVPGTASRGELRFRPDNRFQPGQGNSEDQFGVGLRWFAVPRQPERTYFVAHGTPTEAILPVRGIVQRKGSSETHIAVSEADAPQLSKIEAWTGQPEPHVFRNLILDPAPPALIRPDAPVATLSVEGGKFQIVQIASKIAGLPFRAWSVDGGPPSALLEDVVPTSSRPPRGLEIALRAEFPSRPEERLSLDVRLGHGFVKFVGVDKEGIQRLLFDPPLNQARADLNLRYATGPWAVVADEELGGQTLQATAIIEQASTDHPPTVVRYKIPASARDLDRQCLVYDRQGQAIARGWRSSEQWPKGQTDGIGTLTLASAAPSEVVQIRLLSRPWRQTAFKDIPLQPNSQ